MKTKMGFSCFLLLPYIYKMYKRKNSRTKGQESKAYFSITILKLHMSAIERNFTYVIGTEIYFYAACKC